MEDPGPQVHGEGGSLGGAGVALGDEEKGCACPECGGELPCAAKSCPHCNEVIDSGEKRGGSPEEKSFTTYKGVNDEWRWLSIVNWAVVDKEAELITEQAYRDAIEHAQKTGGYGELDEIHVDGTDVGDCDMLFVLKGGNEPAKLCAGGTWRDTDKATRTREVIQAEPDYWGMSLKFRFDPRRKFRGVYTGAIQALKHSILPQSMAASWGTAIAVQGGNQMAKELDEKTRDALARLGHSEEEIAELAEKQKALPEETNVVEKEDTTTEEGKAGLVETLWRSLGKAAGFSPEVAPDASTPDEARKADEVQAPAQEPEPGEATAKQVEGDTPQPADVGAIAKAFSETLAPIIQGQLEERDKRIATLEAQIKVLGTDIETKVQERLASLPPIATVAPTAAATPAEATGLRFGQPQVGEKALLKELLVGIEQATKDTMGPRGVQV
jgi:hypothetical protein